MPRPTVPSLEAEVAPISGISGAWSIYVDGACQENRDVTAATPAGWGFVVIEGDAGLGRGHGGIVHEANGQVETSPGAPMYLGAEIGSNNTAELSAVAHALRWLLTVDDTRPAVIRADSLYAMNISAGTWRARANTALARTCQRLWAEVASQRPLSWKHVYAHRVHRWNERADHLAKRACVRATVPSLEAEVAPISGISGAWSIYVDGACQENRDVTAATPAGWGFVVIEGDAGLGRGHGGIVHEANGQVETSPGAPMYLGAEIGSNNTAELSAVAHALRWLLTVDDTRPAVIRADSLYAMNISAGTWRARANTALARTCQRLWAEVASQRPLSWKHVRAHRGHRWNERADHLAWRACVREDPLPIEFWKPGKQ